MASGVTTQCAWPGRGESVTELTPFRNFLLHSYTCCSDRHASHYWTSIRRWVSIGFTPSLRKKTNDRTLFLFGACCKCGRLLYTIVAPSCCVPPSYCHLSATLQTMSITVANLKDNFEFLSHFISYRLTHLRINFLSIQLFLNYYYYYSYSYYRTIYHRSYFTFALHYCKNL
jgi:hypothetical protein